MSLWADPDKSEPKKVSRKGAKLAKKNNERFVVFPVGLWWICTRFNLVTV